MPNNKMDYIECKCGTKETYISFSHSVCCSKCFKSLDEKPIENIIKPFVDCVRIDGDFVVRLNGNTIKTFTKYEDYSATEAQRYARVVRNKLNELSKGDK